MSFLRKTLPIIFVSVLFFSGAGHVNAQFTLPDPLPSKPSSPADLGQDGNLDCPAQGSLGNSVRGSALSVGSSEVPVADSVVREEITILRIKECVIDKIVSKISEDQLKTSSAEIISFINEGNDGNSFFIVNEIAHVQDRTDSAARESIEDLEEILSENGVPAEISSRIREQITRDHFEPVDFEYPRSQEYEDLINNGVYSRVGLQEALRNNPLSIYVKSQAVVLDSVDTARELSRVDIENGIVARRDDNCDSENPFECPVITSPSVLEDSLLNALDSSRERAVNTDEASEVVDQEYVELPEEAVSGQGGVQGLDQSFGGIGSILDNILGGIFDSVVGSLLEPIFVLIDLKMELESRYLRLVTSIMDEYLTAGALVEDLMACYESGSSGDTIQRIAAQQIIDTVINPGLEQLEDEISESNAISGALIDLEFRTNSSTSRRALQNLLLEAQTFNSHDAVSIANAERELARVRSQMSILTGEVQFALDGCLGI